MTGIDPVLVSQIVYLGSLVETGGVRELDAAASIAEMGSMSTARALWLLRHWRTPDRRPTPHRREPRHSVERAGRTGKEWPWDGRRWSSEEARQA